MVGLDKDGFAFSPEVRETDDVLRYIDEQGREIDFPRIAPDLPARLHRYEQLTLSQPKQGLYRLSTSDEQRHWLFSQKWRLAAFDDGYGRCAWQSAYYPLRQQQLASGNHRQRRTSLSDPVRRASSVGWRECQAYRRCKLPSSFRAGAT